MVSVGKNWFIGRYCVQCNEYKSCSKEKMMDLCIESEKLRQALVNTQYLEMINRELSEITFEGVKINNSYDYEITKALENLTYEIQERGISVTVSRRD
jgi:hypothetical protein